MARLHDPLFTARPVQEAAALLRETHRCPNVPEQKGG